MREAFITAGSILAPAHDGELDFVGRFRPALEAALPIRGVVEIKGQDEREGGASRVRLDVR